MIDIHEYRKIINIREKYINYLHSNAIRPDSFNTLNEFNDSCNITCILKYDFPGLNNNDINPCFHISFFHSQKLFDSSF